MGTGMAKGNKRDSWAVGFWIAFIFFYMLSFIFQISYDGMLILEQHGFEVHGSTYNVHFPP